MNKINNCTFNKFNTEQISNKDQKRRETLDRDVLTGKFKLIDTKILIEYIKDLYNLNSSCIPFNIRQDHLELFKRLLSAIVFMIFSSDDAVFVKEHYNYFLKARCYGFERHKAELIYLYELLIIKDNQNLVENLQNNLNLRHEEKNFNLEFYIENNIRLFIGKVKMRVFMKTFINFNENQNVLSFDYWKNLLKEHVGIDIYGKKTTYCDKDTFNGREEFGIIGFFKEFTPELLINELYEFLHNDNSFLCKVIEFIKKSGIENKCEYFENDSTLIKGVKREFCEYILKKMQIINFN